jgi:hypothetical protein
MRLSMSLALVLGAAAMGAAGPPALSRVTGGLWELTGIAGSPEPVRQCFSDVMKLAQYEHRSRTCTHTVVSDDGSSTVINYNCGAAGFGRSRIDVLTPRSLRVSTQGISDQLPFAYTIQAHRLGDCGSGFSPRH